MNAGGWIFMIGSLSIVLGLAGWCYYRVFSTKRPGCVDPSERTDD